MRFGEWNKCLKTLQVLFWARADLENSCQTQEGRERKRTFIHWKWGLHSLGFSHKVEIPHLLWSNKGNWVSFSTVCHLLAKPIYSICYASTFLTIMQMAKTEIMREIFMRVNNFFTMFALLYNFAHIYWTNIKLCSFTHICRNFFLSWFSHIIRKVFASKILLESFFYFWLNPTPEWVRQRCSHLRLFFSCSTK